MTQAVSSEGVGTADIGRSKPIRIVEGLDLPLEGEPEQTISPAPSVTSVALVGGDYLGLRHALQVVSGDRVRLGQALFADRKHPEVAFTSPGSGVVAEINRGARRAIASIVVELSGDDEETFGAWPADRLAGLRRDQVIDTLLASGLWVALRRRPFNKVADPVVLPSSIFVTAIDSNPLAPDPVAIIDARREDFTNGLTVVSHLTEGPVYVCQAPRASLPTGAANNVSGVMFSGPHPSGLVGTHIHFLDPVGIRKQVWHLGYQDVIAIGKLFTSGRLWTDRIVALGGPMVERPRLIRTRLGATIEQLTRGELRDGPCRVISGSALSGRHAQGMVGYLGRYDQQVTVLAEASGEPRRNRLIPRWGKGLSAYRLPLPGGGRRRRRFAPTTALHGRSTAMVPLGAFERVMPLDILPTQLLRALLVGDWDMAQALGCLELDEEDLALCTFVCPSKADYGPLLRECLEQIEKES